MKENIKLPLFYGATIEIFLRAEILRNNMTPSEKVLWNKLSNNKLLGYKFRRQHPINKFIADFYCHKVKLVIELDGEIHNQVEVEERDKNREFVIKNFGIYVLRFKNYEVTENLNNVISKIEQKIINLSHISQRSKPL